MEMEMKEGNAVELEGTMERLAATAARLEQAVDRVSERQSALEASAGASLGRVVATVESPREAELEQRLMAAEAEIAELRAAAGSVTNTVTYGRKTVPAAMVTLLAKQGVTVDSMEAGALDAALVSLSIEQRIAVKSQLMRAGLLG
jgi:hypothetical protein